MRGIDVTQEQLAHAEAFMLAGPAKKGLPEKWFITKVNFLTLLAWYGAIRADGPPIGDGYFLVNGERENFPSTVFDTEQPPTTASSMHANDGEK